MVNNLGLNLKLARTSSNLSRTQVSELVGVSVASIGLYETNERTPSLEVLVKLASQYKVSVDYLLGTELNSNAMLPLDGLSEDQIKVLKQTAALFRGISK